MKLYILLLIFSGLFIVGVVVSNKLGTTYIDNKTTQLDNIQKLTNNIANTARQMNADNLLLQRAVNTLQDAELILSDSTTKYNDAIDAWSFYQSIK